MRYAFATLALALALTPGLAPRLALASPSAGSGAAAPPGLSLDQRMLLRCSAAFALVANGQARGDPSALRYPPLDARGKEFFVRSAAEVMDRAGLDRDQLERAIAAQAREIVATDTLDRIMPVCLQALADSGL